jgi:hypothetical protein
VTSESELLEYIRASARNRTTDTEAVRGQVEAIFEELGLPWDRDEAGDWLIRADIGEVRAGLNESGDILSVWQVINELQSKPKQHADLLWELLRLNYVGNGAYFALHQPEDGSAPLLLLMGRLAAERIDPGEVAQTLASLCGMSRMCQ